MEEELPSYLTNVQEFLDKFDNFLLDCDGVNTEFEHFLTGKKVVFVTNNSTQSRQDYQKKLSGFGIHSEISEIYTSGYAAATYLKNANFTKKTYIIGEAGLGKEFDTNGLAWRGIQEHASIPQDLHHVSSEVKTLDAEIGAVVVGMDKYLTYTKVAFALHHLVSNPGCLFIATNTDETLPTDFGVLPGSGSIVKMLETCYGKPPIVCGKPQLSLLDLVISEHAMERGRTIMVGDKLSTDILWGNSGQLATLLVLTGVTSKQELANEKEIIPTYYLNSLAQLNS